MDSTPAISFIPDTLTGLSVLSQLTGQKQTTNYDMNHNRITNLADPISSTDVVNVEFLNAQLAGGTSNNPSHIIDLTSGTELIANSNHSLSTLNVTDMLMNGSTISGLGNPTTNLQAVNKQYCDTQDQSILTTSKAYTTSSIASIPIPSKIQDLQTNPTSSVQCRNGGVDIVSTINDETLKVQGQNYSTLQVARPNGGVQIQSSNGSFGNCNLSVNSMSGACNSLTIAPQSDLTGTSYWQFNQASQTGNLNHQFVGKVGNAVAANNPQLIDMSITEPTQFTTKLYTDTADNLRYLATTPLQSITAPTGDVSMNSHKITNLAAPTVNTDASTKLYVDNAVAGLNPSQIHNSTTGQTVFLPSIAGQIQVSGGAGTQMVLNMTNQSDAATLGQIIGVSTNTSNLQSVATVGYVSSLPNPNKLQSVLDTSHIQCQTTADMSVRGNINMEIGNTYKVTGVKPGTTAGDVVEFNQMNSAISSYHDPSKYDATVPLQSITLATGDLNMNTHKISNVVDPVSLQDVATKHYVDSHTASGSPLEILQLVSTTIPTTNSRVGSWVVDQNTAVSKITYNSAVSTITLQPGFYKASFSQAITTNPNGSLKVRLRDTTSLIDVFNYQYLNGSSSWSVNSGVVEAAPDSNSFYFTLTSVKTVELFCYEAINLVNNCVLYLCIENSAASYSQTVITNNINSQIQSTDLTSSVVCGTNLVTVNQPLAMSAKKITGLADGTLAQDAASKNQLDTGLATKLASTSTLNSIASSNATTADIPMNSHKLTGCSVGVTGTDGACLNNTINDFAVPLSNFSMNSHKITNVLDPTGLQDAATKNYVDSRPVGSVSQLTNTTSSAVLSGTGALTLNDAGTNYLGISDSASGVVLTSAKGMNILMGSANNMLVQGGVNASTETILQLVQPQVGTNILNSSLLFSTTNPSDPASSYLLTPKITYHMNPAVPSDCYMMIDGGGGVARMKLYANLSGVIPSIQSDNEAGYSTNRLSYVSNNSFASVGFVNKQAIKDVMTFINTTQIPVQGANFTTGFSTLINRTNNGLIAMTSTGFYTLQPGLYRIGVKANWTTTNAGSVLAFALYTATTQVIQDLDLYQSYGNNSTISQTTCTTGEYIFNVTSANTYNLFCTQNIGVITAPRVILTIESL